MIIRPPVTDANLYSSTLIKLTKVTLVIVEGRCHSKTYQDLIIHISITTSSRLSSPICLGGCSTGLPVVYHLRIEFLGGLLRRPSTTSSTLATTGLTTASSGTGTLGSCCRLWLRLWLTAERVSIAQLREKWMDKRNTLAEALGRWNCLGTAGVNDELNLEVY